jgi:rhodanese-related sulfurtransferase
MNRPWQRVSTAHIAIGVALGLGALAAFAGTPDRARNARVDVDDLARAVEHEDDHVTAIELAEWIRNRRPGLRVIDIRTSGEFSAMHIPTAERIPLSDLSKTPFRRDETIVLYSEGGAHAGQGWVFLRALGYSQVYFLRGGLREWLDDVMSPTMDSRAGDSAKKAFTRVSDLSRYFGGSPRIGVQRSVESIVPIPAPRDSASLAPAKSGSKWGRGC